jgi:hypothetical protein
MKARRDLNAILSRSQKLRGENAKLRAVTRRTRSVIAQTILSLGEIMAQLRKDTDAVRSEDARDPDAQ